MMGQARNRALLAGSITRRLILFFFQAEDGIRDHCVTGVQTCALPIWTTKRSVTSPSPGHSAAADADQRRHLELALNGQMPRSPDRYAGHLPEPPGGPGRLG